MSLKDFLDRQPLLRVAISLCLGIVVGDGAGLPVWAWLSAMAVAVGLAIALWRLAALQGAAILLATFAFGAAIVSRENRRLDGGLPLGVPLEYEAVVASEPQVRGKTVRCDLLLTKVGGRELARAVRVKASVLRGRGAGEWQGLRVGGGILASSVLQPLAGYHPSSHFDYVRWLRVHGFSAQTFVYWADWQHARVSLRPLGRFQRVRLRAMRLRGRLLARYRLLGLDHQEYAVVAAMTLGDKGSLSQATKDDYAIAGASHVLALSGLHLGILFGILTLLSRRLRRGRWVCQALGLVVVWGYAVIVGMTPSILRAATVLTVYACCTMLSRRPASANALAFAAIVLLVASPLSLWDVGFQLSFLAVLAILVFCGPIYRLLHLRYRLSKAVWGMTAVSLSAQLGTAPLVAYYFGRVSCCFLLANLVAVPAAYLIVGGAVLMLLATPVPSLQQLVATGLSATATWLNRALSALSSLPGASIEGVRLSFAQLVLLYACVACCAVIASFVFRARRLPKLDAFH